jgi:hypothetical protein
VRAVRIHVTNGPTMAKATISAYQVTHKRTTRRGGIYGRDLLKAERDSAVATSRALQDRRGQLRDNSCGRRGQ